ncbi:MAG: adenylate kinase [Candidatus Heimdallarchaeota archaeon]|nr:adenylate kinase [Candidatus Heimdallarchaeota archaeon]
MADDSRIAIIGGVPGVGKTTVINKALEFAKEEGIEILNIVYGTIMMEIAKSEFAIEHRDMLRKLPICEQKEIQRLAAFKIADRARDKITIVDTHFTIRTSADVFLPGIPKWVVTTLEPKLLVLVEANPKEITERRTGDDSRFRDQETIDFLLDHQDINKGMAVTISQQTGALLSIIENREGKVEESGRKLFEHLKNLGK